MTRASARTKKSQNFACILPALIYHPRTLHPASGWVAGSKAELDAAPDIPSRPTTPGALLGPDDEAGSNLNP